MNYLDYMFDWVDPVLQFLLWVALVPGTFLGAIWLAYYMITLRMRRQERGRFLLDVIEAAVSKGRSVEDIIISVSETQETSIGLDFHLLAFYLKDGIPLNEAIRKVPRLLPSQVSAMLAAGLRIGDLGKVLPACRQLSKDALSQTRGALNYLVLFAFIGFPINLLVFAMLQIYVFPQFMTVCVGMLDYEPAGLVFLMDYRAEIMAAQVFIFLAVWLALFIYTDGPRTFSWFTKPFSPISHAIVYRLPWRRKRLQRDFATMLAILIDAGMPEPEALTLAADCTANEIILRRAQEAVTGLQNGMRLAEAVQLVDDAGEFRWRLTQGKHTEGGFAKAMAGWNESLDAKAFEQEQAAAQTITTGFVLLNGVMIGFIVISAFSVLVSIINGAILW